MFALKKKSKIILKLILLSFLMQYFNHVAGQGEGLLEMPDMVNYKDVLPASPNAASLGKYGEIPVSTYTGIPNISIPLWELKTGTYKLPISLSYHASGIKVSEIASWVGTGWSLNAGGVITRSVNGRPDEVQDYGYWDLAHLIPAPEDYDNWEPNNMWRAAQGLDDYQPDEYSFNFAGYSGKFFITEPDRSTGEFKVFTANYTNLKIVINLDPTHDKIESIIITTEDGIKYTFGTGPDYIENLVPLGNPCTELDMDNTYITAWYLASIELPVGNKKIRFRYKSVDNKVVETLSESSYTNINAQNGFGDDCGSIPNSYCPRTIEYEQLLLDSIISQDYEITFHTKGINIESGYQLDTIEIKSLINDSNRILNFEYTSYAGHGRNFLNKVWINNTEPYIFEYYHPGELAGYGSFAVDYWGFYNGEPNTTYVPKMIFNDVEHSGADRNPSYDKTKYGSLSRITYPTKGYTEFTFEAHDFATDKQDNVLNYSEMYTEVELDIPLGTSGMPFIDSTVITINYDQYINYRFFAETYFQDPVDGYVSFTKVGETVPVKTLNPNGGIENTDITGVISLLAGDYIIKAHLEIAGVHIKCEVDYKKMEGGTAIEGWRNEFVGGLRIKELQNYNPDGELLTKKEYKYRQFNEPSLSSGILMNENLIFKYTYIKYSRLDMHCDYIVRTSSASNHQRTSSGSHIVYNNVTEYIGGFVPTDPHHPIEGPEPFIGEGANGKIQYTFTFRPDGNINDAMPYAPATSYDWQRGLPLKKTYMDNVGDTVKLEKFTYDYSDMKKIPGFKVSLVAEHYTDITYEYASKYYHYLSGNQYNSSKTTIDFKNNARILRDSTSYLYYLGSKRLYSQTSFLPDNTELQKIYMYPDSLDGVATWIDQLKWGRYLNWLISQEVIKTGLDGVPKVLNKQILTYQDKMPYSVFALKNTEAMAGASIKYANIYENSDAASSDFYKKLTVENDTSTGNMLEYTTEDGIPTAIIWGYNNTYPVAKIEGAYYNDVMSKLEGKQAILDNPQTNAALRGIFTDLRNDSLNLRITVNTYDPLSGITSATDPNGKITYYDYDSYGRLKLIRDNDKKILKSYAYIIGGHIAQKPTGLLAPSIEYNQIQLDWEDVEGAKEYKIYSSTDNINYTFSQSVSTSSYTTPDNLNPSTTYYYKISSVVNYLESDAAFISVTTKMEPPTKPTISSAIALLNSSIQLNWADVDNESGYSIFRGTTSSNITTFVGDLPAGSTTFTDRHSLLSPAFQYFYVVKARNDHYSVSSDTKAVFTLPDAPSGLTASAPTNTDIDISWSDVERETGYVIYRSNTSSGPYANPVYLDPNETFYKNSGLSGDKTYYYKVIAVRDTDESEPSYIACKTKQNPPGKPNLTLSCSSSSIINLSWNNVDYETEYRIYRGLVASSLSLIEPLPANATSYSNTTGLVAGNTYYYKVDAYNSDYITSSDIKYISTIPEMPGAIFGESSPCENSVETYYVDPVNGASYEWEVPLGWTINSGQGSRTITLTIGSGTKNSIKVRAYNTTGYSGYSLKPLFHPISVPPAAGAISGEVSVIPTDVETYTISPVNGATYYNWTKPLGCTILSGQGSTSITVQWGLNSGYIRVRPENCVGESTSATQKYVTVQGGGGQ